MRGRAGLGLALSLTIVSGCGGGPLGSADDESGTDTDAPSPACLMQGLHLSEGYSGRISSSVMFPQSRGGTNSTTSSCGGGGVDQSYLITSQKTSYYHIGASSDDGEALTYHVHAGDSCDGPELLCTTAPQFALDLMLEQGESVVIVVDAEPDLVIPDAGIRYSVGVSWGTAPPEPCQADAYDVCAQDLLDALEPCLAGVACGAFDVSEAPRSDPCRAIHAFGDATCGDRAQTRCRAIHAFGDATCGDRA